MVVCDSDQTNDELPAFVVYMKLARNPGRSRSFCQMAVTDCKAMLRRNYVILAAFLSADVQGALCNTHQQMLCAGLFAVCSYELQGCVS